MKNLPYLGVLLVLIGVSLLVVPFLMGTPTNRWLTWGLLFVIGGFLLYIFLNKRIR